jgi:hypothetical protein
MYKRVFKDIAQGGLTGPASGADRDKGFDEG